MKKNTKLLLTNKKYILAKFILAMNISFFLIVISTLHSYAAVNSHINDVNYYQTQEIKGKVVDDKGVPIPGVNILIKGTTNVGTTTDVNGDFTIKVDSENTILIFSFVGMQSQEISVGTNTYLTVNLLPEAATIEEVVFVAYGKQRKGTITGSVEVVSSKKIDQSPTASLSQALQGKVTGLQVVQNNGMPGAQPIIQLRGAGSINASNSPLFVLDGIPTSSLDFRSLNSNDIESVSVLKDASAASLYGSRAGNGVILITTKRGKSGATNFTFRVMSGFSTKTSDKFKMMNAKEFIDYEILLGRRSANDPKIDSLVANNHSWLDDILRTGINKSYELSASGGSDKTRFYTSVSYFKQDGIIKTNDLQRYNIRVNLDQKVNDALSFGTSLTLGRAYRNTITTAVNGSNPLISGYMNHPYDRVKKPDGTWGDTHWGGDWNIFEMFQNITQNATDYKGLGNIYLEYKPFEDLVLKESVGLDMAEYESYYYLQPDARDVIVNGAKSNINQSSSRSLSTLSTSTATYHKTFNDVHEIKVLAGLEVQKRNYYGISAIGQNLPSDQITVLSAASTPFRTTGFKTLFGLTSYFSSLSYYYNTKYLLDLSVRRDGSTRFGKDNQYGNFWSLGLGWNLQLEDFIKAIDPINVLKLRASIGTSGNQEFADFTQLDLYGYSKYNNYISSYPSQLGNPNLTWEKNEIKSLNLEFAIFKNRIKGQIDLYDRTTKSLLQYVPMPTSSGFYGRYDNVGSISNKGIEFSMNSDILKANDFTYNLGFSITSNKNKVLKLSQGKDILSGDANQILREGEPVWEFYLVRYAGVNTSNGEPLYYTKDGKVTNVWNSDDQVLQHKSPTPKYFGTITNEITYKNFGLSAALYYSVGNYVFNGINEVILSDGQEQGNQAIEALTESWHQPGDRTELPRQSQVYPRSPYSTRDLENASFLRLTDVTLSYSMPKKITQKLKLNAIKVYAKGLNLYTFTKFRGMDPELTYGTWTFNYPPSRLINFGIDISF